MSDECLFADCSDELRGGGNAVASAHSHSAQSHEHTANSLSAPSHEHYQQDSPQSGPRTARSSRYHDHESSFMHRVFPSP